MRDIVLAATSALEVADHDVDLIAQLCAMAQVPTGEEDPHAILRSMSEDILDDILRSFERVKSHHLLAPICQFFFVEWCYRNSYLVSDWKWSWDSSSEGHVAYKACRPIENIFSGRDVC